MTLAFATRLLILVLAWLLGAEVTRRVTADRRPSVQQLLTTFSGVIVVAAILAAGRTETRFGTALGIIAVTLATTHVVLAWFANRPESPAPAATPPASPPQEPAA